MAAKKKTTTRKASPSGVKTKAALERELLQARADIAQSMSAALSRSFNRGGRLRRNYAVKVGSGDRVLDLDREALRDTSRNIDMLSETAHAFHNRIVDAVIGRGLRPLPKHREARPLAERFLAWMDRADHRGVLDGGDLQRLTLRSMVVDGDVGTIKTNQRTLQTVESDQIATIGNTTDTLDGIVYDESGRIREFVVHPYDRWGVSPEMNKEQRVDARFVILLANRTRPSMTRGLPMLSSALDRLADIDELLEAVIQAAKLAACLALVAETSSPGQFANALSGSQSTTDTGGGTTKRWTDFDPGTLLFAPTGTEIKSFQGSQPQSQLDGFIRFLLQTAAASVGFPVEYILRDNSKANYSVSRAMRLQVEEAAAPLRRRFVDQWLTPVWRWWVAGEAADGTLEVAVDKALAIDWSTPPLHMLDPQKDLAAAVVGIQNNLLTKDEFLAERGRTSEAVAEDRAAEKRLEEELDIVPPMLPGSPESSAQPASDESEPDPTPTD